MKKKQKVFHWKSGRAGNSNWDYTDDLNKELESGWSIVGHMQPSVIIDPGSPTGENAVYRSTLVILEKEE